MKSSQDGLNYKVLIFMKLQRINSQAGALGLWLERDARFVNISYGYPIRLGKNWRDPCDITDQY